MSSYKELKMEFNEKVEALREHCKHDDVSDWLPYHWAIAHVSRFEVVICNVCRMTIMRRTSCDFCNETIVEPDWVEGDGKSTPYGCYFCSNKCAEGYDKKHKISEFGNQVKEVIKHE